MENNKEKQEPDYKNLYIQALADYKNLQRRTDAAMEQNIRQITYIIMSDFFPVYNNAKRGLEFKEKGCELIYNTLVQILQNHNIDIINDDFFKEVGIEYNDKYATALGVEQTDDPELDNKISKVIEDGFIDITTKFVLVPAKVLVYKCND